jgi:hypothetical protein
VAPAFRAPSFRRAQAGNAAEDDGLPGAAKNTGDESRLKFEIEMVSGEGAAPASVIVREGGRSSPFSTQSNRWITRLRG